MRFLRFAAFLLVAAGCSSSTETAFDVPDRAADERAPRTAACDDLDELRCLLPWPSNAFTVADPTTATGLRLEVERSSLIRTNDEPELLSRADGFSRVTPLVTGFSGKLAPATGYGDTGPMRLFRVDSTAPIADRTAPLRIEVVSGEGPSGEVESFVFGHPLRPLDPSADYVAVVLDELETEDGSRLGRTRATELALGLVEPASRAEAELRAHFAPARAVLAEAGIDATRVLRMWDFTTRSALDATKRLRKMAELSVEAASSVSVAIDLVEQPEAPEIAAIVEGRLVGLPRYLDETNALVLDAAGLPVASGNHDVPFRVVIPAGEGDYPFVMYGHGMGGNVHDSIFDEEFGGIGLGKVGVRFLGFTDDDVVDTLTKLGDAISGGHRAAAQLMQSIADGAAIQAAMGSVLADALAAPKLGEVDNPAAGRRPQTSFSAWVGGSLGGTMSLVAASVIPEVRYGVLNVPGAAWTHFIARAQVFDVVRVLIRNGYGSDLDVFHALATSQGLWDEADGASFTTEREERDLVFLLQQSMEDPVLPNAGTEMAAIVASATHVGTPLSPIWGLSQSDTVRGASGITQYRVPKGSSALEIHGFASRSTPAGAAAREQIREFLESARAGSPTIVVPSGCVNGSCDFATSVVP